MRQEDRSCLVPAAVVIDVEVAAIALLRRVGVDNVVVEVDEVAATVELDEGAAATVRGGVAVDRIVRDRDERGEGIARPEAAAVF